MLVPHVLHKQTAVLQFPPLVADKDTGTDANKTVHSKQSSAKRTQFMMAAMDFAVFTARVAGMPHISAKMIQDLDIVDVASCLKSCKVVRTFITDALKHDKHLQRQLDNAVISYNSRLGQQWRSDNTTILSTPATYEELKIGASFYEADILGIDGSIWISARIGKAQREELEPYEYMCYVYNRRNMLTKIPCDGSMHTLETLADGRLLVRNHSEVRVMRLLDDCLVQNRRVFEKTKTQPYVFIDDCTYWYSKSEGILTVFDEQYGCPTSVKLSFELDTVTSKILKKVGNSRLSRIFFYYVLYVLYVIMSGMYCMYNKGTVT